MKMSNEITYSGRFFGGDAVRSVSLHLAAGLSASQLEADTLTAVVKTGDPSITSFQRNTPLKFRHRENPMRVLGDSKLRAVVDKGGRRVILVRPRKAGSALPTLFQGTFYLQSVERTGPDSYTLFAVSAIGLLMERAHAGGIYTGESAERVIKSICGSVPVLVKSNLRYTPLYGWLPYARPPQSSARDNLCQVLFALGAAIRADAEGVLRVFRLWPGFSGAAPAERIYQGAGVEYGGAVSAVSVSEHQYAAEGAEAETLYEGTAAQGDMIFFQEPMYGLEAEGFSILESGSNYAMLSQGDGVLTGQKYRHSIREIQRVVTPRAAENVISVTDATLLSLTNARFAAERLAGFYQARETVKCGVILKQQSAGDAVQVFHPYDEETVPGCVESMDVNASGILRTDMRILAGWTPPAISNAGYYNQRVLITESGTVNIPAGATFLRAVLIGGGEGGGHGQNGENGQKGGDASYRGKNGESIGVNGLPGKGGKGGIGGKAGKVLIADIDNPASFFTVYIGHGGMAQASAESPLEKPAETLIASTDGFFLSSADGALLEHGYRDIITGEIYAISGEDGVDGGDGGEAGGIEEASKTEWDQLKLKAIPGEAGENVEPLPEDKADGYTTWHGGAGNKTFRQINAVGSGNTSRVVSYHLPAGGGGAAYGRMGFPAGTKEFDVGGEPDEEEPIDPMLWGTGGGAGNRPAPRKMGTIPGSGGDGGHGGGGGGAGASAAVFVRSSSWEAPTRSDSQSGMPGGRGGRGGKGANGTSGCVILYFSSQASTKTGAIMDSKERFVLDKFGRLIVT